MYVFIENVGVDKGVLVVDNFGIWEIFVICD